MKKVPCKFCGVLIRWKQSMGRWVPLVKGKDHRPACTGEAVLREVEFQRLMVRDSAAEPKKPERRAPPPEWLSPARSRQSMVNPVLRKPEKPRRGYELPKIKPYLGPRPKPQYLWPDQPTGITAKRLAREEERKKLSAKLVNRWT